MLSDLTLKKSDASSWVYSKLSSAGDTSVFLGAGSTQLSRNELVIKNSLGGPSPYPGTKIRRTLLSHRITRWDDLTQKRVPFTINYTLTGFVDGTVLTTTDVKDAIAALNELLTQSTSANLTKLLNGEL